MKRIFSLLLITMFCMVVMEPANAQILRFGLKGGLNLSKLDTEISVGNLKETSQGFFIGPMVEATIPIIGIGIDVAAMYSQRGSDETKQQGVEVPVNLKYSLGLGSTFGVFFAVGPDFFFNLKDVEWGNSGVVVNRKKTELSLNLGLGLKLIKHLQLGVNYQIGLSKKTLITPGQLIETIDADAGAKIMEQVGSTSKQAKFNTWQLSLAYTF